MLTNARHQEIVDSLREAYEREVSKAGIAQREAKARENDIIARANQAVSEFVTDLNKLSAEVSELREYKAHSERVIEHLRSANTLLIGQNQGHADLAEKLEEAIEARLATERDLELYRQREKANRTKAVKERDAEVKAARKARKLAAENGEQWAVEAILNPLKLGLFS